MLKHIESLRDYQDYQETVGAFFTAEGITNLSACSESCEECGGEPSFSWASCDACSRDLGGDRHHATGWNPTLREVQEYRVCSDCIYYAEYAELDDRTMLEVMAKNGTGGES